MAHIRVYNITKDDRIIAATPLYHSLAERLVILPLILGATSVLLPRFTPALWLKCAEEQKPTFTIAVSAQLAQILELLKKLNARLGISMLLISHNLNVVRKLCSRIAVMKRGLIVEIGDTESVFLNPQHDYTKALIKAIPTRERRFG